MSLVSNCYTRLGYMHYTLTPQVTSLYVNTVDWLSPLNGIIEAEHVA